MSHLLENMAYVGETPWHDVATLSRAHTLNYLKGIGVCLNEPRESQNLYGWI